MKKEEKNCEFDGTLLLPLEEFIKFWSFHDTDEVYTNNSKLIDVYRLKQWIDYHIYKNDINNENIKIKEAD